MVAVLVGDEHDVNVAELQPGTPIEFFGHLLGVGERWIGQKSETVALDQHAGADGGADALGVALTPIAVARQVAEGDDVPALDLGVLLAFSSRRRDGARNGFGARSLTNRCDGSQEAESGSRQKRGAVVSAQSFVKRVP